MKIQAKLETERTRVYRKSYRPSPDISHFIKTLIIVLLEGQSPYGPSYPMIRRKK